MTATSGVLFCEHGIGLNGGCHACREPQPGVAKDAYDRVVALAQRARLTEREREVLALRLVGLTFREVAEVLELSLARPHQLERSAVAKMRAAAADHVEAA